MVFGKCLLGHIVVGHSVLRLYLPKSFAGLPFCLAQRFRGLNLARCFIHGFPFARSSRCCPTCSWAVVIGKVRLIRRGSPRGRQPNSYLPRSSLLRENGHGGRSRKARP